jgi:hypothetical protein
MESNNNAEEKHIEVPRTRIASIFIYLNYFAAGILLLTTALGPLIPYFDNLFWFHLTSGLASAVIGLFALVSAMFYLVVSGMGIKEGVENYGLPKELFALTRQFKKELFPWCSATIVLLITMTVLGGGVHVKKVNKHVHLAFAVVTILAYVGTLRSIKSCYARNATLIGETLEAIEAKQGL